MLLKGYAYSDSFFRYTNSVTLISVEINLKAIYSSLTVDIKAIFSPHTALKTRRNDI